MRPDLFGMKRALSRTEDPEITAISFAAPVQPASTPQLQLQALTHIEIIAPQQALVVQLAELAAQTPAPTGPSLQDRVRSARVELRRARTGRDRERLSLRLKTARTLEPLLKTD